ncbi:MAG TPA: PssD/Cps14F family polysaccharide biosynthesis glycosyltransferase [Anaerolineales bacterium]|nr:PssD/Cps14F family polysaccharide biosynthesis glycosyltransferase [Anaerolineales bacterium]
MKIALVCTHGGHLTETLQVLEAFDGHEIFFVTHTSARDEEIRKIAPAYFSRNIGERWYLLPRAFFEARRILRRERPQVIFSTGAEIALPFFFWGKLYKIKTIFLESWCRVEGPSRTGRLVYPLADEFWVQWPQLAQICGPKAKYNGAVI